MKLKSKYTFLLVLAGMCQMPLQAQQTYSLEDCIREALINNVRMKNAANDLKAAQETRSEAFTRYFPSVSAAGSGFIADKGLLQMSLSPEMEMSMMKNGVIGGVSATLPLFTGGQLVNGNKLAKTGIEAGRLQLRRSENEVTLTVENYFWQVVMLEEKLHTLQTVEEQLAGIAKDAEAAVKAGVSNRNDLLQVQLRRNETKSGRINLENSLALARNLLAQYIGHPADSIRLSVSLDGSVPENPESLRTDHQASLPLTPEYGLLQQQVKSGRLQYKMAVGKNLPTIAIGGGYFYENLMDRDHSFWMGFATVSVPLSGWWGGSHNMKKQKLQWQNAENQLTDQSERLIIRMEQAWNDLNNAYQQVKIACESIEQATENLRLNTDYYTAGTCTMSDLLEAQTLYRQSRDQYVDAYSLYEVKKREYLQATGR